MSKKLQAAGLESPVEQGRFFLIRTVCAILGPGLGLTGYHYLPTYYATLLMITCSAIGLVTPILWLKGKTSGRNEDIQRELPLVLDLTNLGTSAGWDVAASLERVIDVLYKEFPNHPLLKEFKRARWLTASGYTWEEALDRVSKRLVLDSVRRSTLALGQAMKQGGDRTSQLEGIAEDAQRNYYAELDKRLATLPVKVLLITMGLMIAYFIIILAPAAVQIKRILFG
jgi:pilus assembly protein TadC